MTTSKIPTIPTYSPEERQQECQLPYTLKWRQKQLLVFRQSSKQPHLPFVESQRLVECLKHSLVRLIRIEPELGEASLKLWADACEQAKKPIFLRVPSTAQRQSKRLPSIRWLSRLISWSAAAILLLVLSPIMLALICLIRIQSPEPILCRQWHVGERGKLFRLLKFRTIVVNPHLHKTKDDLHFTRFGLWCKYSLEKLPQLFNVLRGEMSLVGPRPWTLHDAVQINLARQQVNALPGIICLKFPQQF